MYKILVVDDAGFMRKMVQTHLTKAGYTDFIEGEDGARAVELYKENKPDLVIMDIQMPHVSGLDLIEAMQKDEALKAIPVLAVTAYAGKGDEERIMAAGARSYLSKPVAVMKFLEAVRGIIG